MTNAIKLKPSSVVRLFYLLSFVFSLSVDGQTDEQRERIRQSVGEQKREQKKYDELKGLEVGEINLSFFKLSAEDKKLIAPSETDQTKYADVLKLPNVKIVKLLNISCRQIGAVTLSARCFNNTIPGFGNSYSFRDARHLPPSMADLKLADGKLAATGFFAQGILVSLGEIDFDKISLNSTGVNFLTAFSPAQSPADANRQIILIASGIEKDGYKYSRAFPIKVNDVYAMRSIAYRLRVESLDKREDVTIIFKVISQDDDGNVTLIWRKLQSKPAPKLKAEK